MSLPSGPPKTILVADDSRPIRSILSVLLRNRGYVVLEAVDGNDALEQALALSPDFILLDVQMPGRTGLEVCLQLKSNDASREIPILLLTAAGIDPEQSEEQGATLAKADGFLEKPFRAEELLAQIAALLTRGSESGKTEGIRSRRAP